MTIRRGNRRQAARIAVFAALALLMTIGPGITTVSATNVTDAAGVDSNAELEPVADRLPTDPNGDGLYEDIDGDGRWTFVDVNTFFQRSSEPVIRNHTAAYDFNGDGKISLQDVMTLFLERYDGDGDGLSTSKERELGTDPRLADTDGDGIADGQEVENGTDPTVVNLDAGVECSQHCDVSSRSVAVASGDTITAAGPRRTGPTVDIEPNTTYSGDIDPADADVVVAQDGSGDAESIQGGVDAASAGDVVYVRSGSYSEEVLVDERVHIVGPNATLDGSDQEDGAVAFNLTTSATIAGVTIDQYDQAVRERNGEYTVAIDSITVRHTPYLVISIESASDWSIENVRTVNGGDINTVKSRGNWTIESVVLNGTGSAIYASDSTGDWTVSEVLITASDGNGVYALDAAGDWSVSDVRMSLPQGGNGIYATEASGNWSVTNADIDLGRASNGIFAPYSTGEWDVSESSIVAGSASSGIDATYSTSNWSIVDFAIDVNDSSNGISAGSSAGSWGIVRGSVSSGGNGIYTSGGTGDWSVRETAIDAGSVGYISSDTEGIVRVSNVTFDLQDSIGMDISSQGDLVSIENVTVENGTGILGRGAADWTIRNIVISDGHQGIKVNSKNGTVAISNVVASEVDLGITSDGTARSWTIRDAIVRNASTGITLDGEGRTTVESALVKNATDGIERDESERLSVSEVTLTGISDVAINHESGAGTANLSSLRVSGPDRAIRLAGSGSTTVSEAIVHNASTGVLVTGDTGPSNVSVRRSRFLNTGRAIWTDTGLDRVSATEFRWVDEAINASETTATVDARGNWWGSDGLDDADTAGDVLTGDVCEEPCAGDLRTSGALPSDILPTASLATGEGVAVWDQRFGTTENATVTIDYETTALGENASVTLIAGPTTNDPRFWDLDPSTGGTVERPLDARRFESSGLAGKRVTMILKTTGARASISNLTVG